MENKEICDKIYYMTKKGRSFKEICEQLGLKDYEIVGLVTLMSREGYNIDFIDGEIVLRKVPKRNQDTYEIPYNLEHLKLLLISDTHLCSKYDRLDILRYLYDKAEDKGVKHILHSGDFTDGRSTRPEHIYELKEPSYAGQVEYCVEKYPKFSGNTYAIQGNHDD